MNRVVSFTLCTLLITSISVGFSPAQTPTSSKAETPLLLAFNRFPIVFDFGTPGVAAPRFTLHAYGCNEVTTSVSMNSRSLTGPGHCAGETVGYLSNNSGAPAACAWAFLKSGAWTGGGEITLATSAQSYGGEAGGIWSCGTESDQMRYACFPAGATDATGRDCRSNLSW